MSLLNSDDMELAKRAARVLRERRHAAVGIVLYGADGKRVPSFSTRLRPGSPEAKAHLRQLAIKGRRDAESEQPGAAAQLIENPDIQQAMVEEFSDG